MSIEAVLTDNEFRVLLDLAMTSDPWPLTAPEQTVFLATLDKLSQARGYLDWVDAYHRLPRLPI